MVEVSNIETSLYSPYATSETEFKKYIKQIKQKGPEKSGPFKKFDDVKTIKN